MSDSIDFDNDWDDDFVPEFGDDDVETVPCPYCRKPIPEDTPRCPYCENYISDEDAPPRPRSPWFFAGFLLCLVVLCVWVFGRI